MTDILAYRIPDAIRVSGLSRSGLYRAAAEGALVLRKVGGSTLVDGESLRQFIGRLPVAEVKR